MRRHLRIPLLSLAAAVAAAPARAQDRPPSAAEIRALIERAIANQHNNDAALWLYERIERRQIRKNPADATPAEDKTFRVVPAGTGNARALVEENGKPVDAALYRKQLADVQQGLTSAADPEKPGRKQELEKFAKKMRERAELVDAIRDAFRFSWADRETHQGRALAKLNFEPNPEFRAASRSTSFFLHVRGALWIDESAAQVVRIEAEVFSDISFVGGIAGKVYRGSRFTMEQAEIAPGVWLPTLYDYNLGGRKFLFGFEIHERTEVSQYRRIGPPSEAAALIRKEIENSQPNRASP